LTEMLGLPEAGANTMPKRPSHLGILGVKRFRASGAQPVSSGAAHHLARLEHLLDQL
jgi:hypothetical protein